MYELKNRLEKYLRVNLLGPGPRLIKKNLLSRGLTKVEKHCSGELALEEAMVLSPDRLRMCTHTVYSSLCLIGCEMSPL